MGSWPVVWVPALLVDGIFAVFRGAARVISGEAGGENNSAVQLVAAAGLLLFLWTLQKYLRHRQAYRPGAVDIRPLSNATGDSAADVHLNDLSAHLRDRLSKAQLRSPSAVPTEAPPETFLDVIGDVNVDPKKPWASLPQLLRGIQPRVAYRVSGEIRFRKTAPCYGVTALSVRVS